MNGKKFSKSAYVSVYRTAIYSFMTAKGIATVHLFVGIMIFAL